MSRFNPDLVFLVLSSGHLKLTTALVQALRRENTSPSVVVAIENPEPGELLKLLEIFLGNFKLFFNMF